MTKRRETDYPSVVKGIRVADLPNLRLRVEVPAIVRQPIEPEWLRAMRRASSAWQRELHVLQEGQARAIQEAIRPLVDWGDRMERAFGPWRERFAEWGRIAAEVARELEESIARAKPANWSELELEDVGAALDLMVTQGLNVAWVPRAEVVRELLAAADTDARDAVLVARAVEVLEDVEASLVAVEYADLAPAADALQEAVAAFRDGHGRAAQALAAATVTAILHDSIGERNFGRARERFEALDPNDVPFTEAKGAAVMRCMARAIEPTWVAQPGFNRHAVAHGLSANQYTKPNALASLMLVAGLLREVDYWLEADTEAEPSSGDEQLA